MVDLWIKYVEVYTLKLKLLISIDVDYYKKGYL